MRQTPLDIVAGSYADETRPFSSQDTVNYLPVFAEQGGTRTPTMLKTPPGLRPFVQVMSEGSPTGPARRTHNCEGKLFAVLGQTLYQVTPSGVAIPQGTIPGISRCSMAHNQLATGNQLVTVNGTSGYVFNTQSQVFERIADEGFPGAIKVIFMDGYIVGIEPRRRFAFCSEIADALAYNTLDRFTSEYLPDLLVSLESVQNQIVLFSEGSMEFFENTGATEQPFRSKRISQKRGCAGTFTTAVIDQTVYWLGDDGIFYRLEGYAPKRISTRPIEQAIRGLDWKNAFAETWTDAGHLVVYWTFPDGLTWGYDISSGQWHRRESYGFSRWRPNTLTYINSEWVAGDFQSGRLWKLDWDYVLEGDDEIISERVTQTLADNQNRMLISRVELIVDTGQPITEPVDFPEQPEGPSISGDAPEGSVGEAYSFSYTVTGGTGAKRVTLRSGTLPPGLTLSQTGVLSGAPTEYGSFSFVVRATDENGLFDDLADHIPVVLPMILSANLGVSNTLIIPSAGGVVWNAAPISASPDNKYGLIGIEGGRYFGNGSASSTPARYSDDEGASWTNTVANVVMGMGMCYASGRLLLGNHTSGMLVSTDRGQTFTASAHTAGRVINLKYNSPIVCGLQGGTQGANVYHSTDAGVTFGTSIPHDLNYTTGGMLGTDGVDFYLGAQIGGNPVLKKYTTGGVLSTETLPTLSAGFVIAFGANEDIKIFATNTGQICVNDGSGWELLTDTFAHACNQIYWNGAVFIAPTGASAAPGAMYTSQSGRAWTISPMAGAYTPNTVAQQAPDV